MATTTTTLGTSNLRSSSRQTRTNPSRTSKSLASSVPAPPVAQNEPPQNIYPAIQHLSDSFSGLPREYRRHTSLLKEVDAKAFGLEENLQKLLGACISSKPARCSASAQPSAAASTTGPPDSTAAMGASSSLAGRAHEILSQASSLPAALQVDPATNSRRELFGYLRLTLERLMVPMDEKNHVINNANDELGRQLQRLNTVFPRLDAEISDEVREGSSIHWAYAENKAAARAIAGGESRSRKEAAAGLAIMSNEHISARSESRREAVRENKRLKAAQQQQQQDSEADDSRGPGKKPNANGKAKRVGELAAEANPGLGISNAPAPARKKRPEKVVATSSTIMERTTSSGSHIGGTAMSRQTSQQEGTKKRRAPKDATTTGARKRTHTANSAANSPLLASSPVVASHTKEPPRSSPAPRPQIPRGRQNSAQNDIVKARPGSSTSNRAPANGSNVVKTPDLQQTSTNPGKFGVDTKPMVKEPVAKNGDRLFGDELKGGNIETEVTGARGDVHLERSSSKASHTEKLKREADDSSDGTRGRKGSSAAPSPRLPPSSLAISEAAPPVRPDRRRAASSKTSTPVVSTFEEAAASKSNGNRPPNRPSRQNTLTSTTSSSDGPPTTALQPVKRSHKKGAGLAAQAAAAAAKAAAEKSRAGEEDEFDEDGGEEAGENEPRYCYCNQVSYGEMIACDADDCPREWFHLECAGLDQIPGRNAKWYCNECKERLKKGKGVQSVVR